MASVAYEPITLASCNVRNPLPPADASSADLEKLRDLCDIACKRYRQQKGKDSLEQRARAAKMGNSAYHIYKDSEGKDKKQLKNKEFLVAGCLLHEGSLSAVPVGWFIAAPAGVTELGPFDAMPVQVPTPQPAVYEMPSVPPP